MKIFMVGAGPQARICRRVLMSSGLRDEFPIVYDSNLNLQAPWPNCRVMRDLDEAIEDAQRMRCNGFVVAMGSEKNNRRRCEISEQLKGIGLTPVPVVHKTSYCGDEMKCGMGLHLLNGAAIGDEVKIGNWCLINSFALVEHNSVLEDGASVMVGAVVCSNVHIGPYAAIGANATIMPDVHIGEGAIVGAGTVVTKTVENGQTVIGVPGRPIAERLQLRNII